MAAAASCSLMARLSCALQIVAYDFGCKSNILRRLTSFGCRVTVVPASYPADKVMEMNPDGVFLSNGPVCVPALGLPHWRWVCCLAASALYFCPLHTTRWAQVRVATTSRSPRVLTSQPCLYLPARASACTAALMSVPTTHDLMWCCRVTHQQCPTLWTT